MHRNRITVMIAAVAAMLALAVPAGAGHTTNVVTEFDESAFENPEGIAVNRHGDIFVGLAALGDIVKVDARSGDVTPFAHVDVDPLAGDFGVLGIEIDRYGNVWAGVASFDPSVNGIWRFTGLTGEGTRVAGSEQIIFPNDLVFDHRGDLFITDSVAGAIWRLPRGGTLEPWLVGDDNIAGTGALGLGIPIGANGIDFHGGTLYVAVTEQFSLVEVPVMRNGRPGPSKQVATFAAVPDGVAVDSRGNAFVALINSNEIVVVTPRGAVSTVASGDPLDWPSSVAFGSGRAHPRTLYAVNFSIGEGNGDTVERFGPAVVAIAVRSPRR